MSNTPDSQALLSLLPTDGSPVGNISLRNSLGWDEERYFATKQELLLLDLVATGKGKGGSLMRKRGSESLREPESFEAPQEMFDSDAITSSPDVRETSSGSIRNASTLTRTPVTSYQHSSASRKNIPPAGIATPDAVDYGPHRLSYDPHLSPVLRFDSSAGTDLLTAKIQSILAKSRTEPLTPEETQLLSDALLRSRQPWLEWAGKREKRWFEVDPVALHIHERVSANAILKAAQRQDVEHDLFADHRLSREEALQFYKHDVDWANRLILGDSLQVMSSR